MFNWMTSIHVAFIWIIILSTASATIEFGFTNLTFYPESLKELQVGDTIQIYGSFIFRNDSEVTNLEKIVINLHNDEPSVVSLQAKQPLEFYQFDFNETNDFDTFDFSFNLTGVFVGRSFISTVLQVRYLNGSGIELSDLFPSYAVPVWRKGSKYEIIFTIVVSFLSAITTFLMGTQVEWEVIKRVLRKPVAPAIGFLCQYLLMPLIALGWGKLLLAGEPLLQLGYFAVGCCPGGKASNYWSILLNANLDLSVTLTIISNLAAFVMLPLWLMTVGKYAFDTGAGVYIPFPNMVGSLLLLIIPTVAGMIVRVKKPPLAEKLGKLLKPLTILIVVILVVVANAINWYIYLLFTVKKVLAGILLPWTGFVVSFLLAWMARRDFRDMKTIAIETGIQNASVAIIIILFSLNHPDSDLTLVMPIVCLIFTPLPLVLVGLYMLIKTCIQKRNAAKTGDIDQNGGSEKVLDAKHHTTNGHTNIGMANIDEEKGGESAKGKSPTVRPAPDPVYGTYGVEAPHHLASSRLPPLK